MGRQHPNPQLGRSAGTGSAQSPQQSPSPSNGALATTALDNCHIYPGDVVGNRVTVAPGNSATSSLDNASRAAGEQGLRTWM